MFKSAKIQMGWKSNITTLVPIALSSIIACISALIKFRNFPAQMEILDFSRNLYITCNKKFNKLATRSKR